MTMTAAQAVELKKIADESNIAVNALREEHAKGEKANKEVMKKANDQLDELETKNQAFALQFETDKTEKAELKEALTHIETKLSRMRTSDTKNGRSDEYKAGMKMILHGVGSPEEMKLLRTDNSADGGVLVHNEISNEMLKNIVEISPMRSLARVMQSSHKAVELSRRNVASIAYWIGERETVTKSTSTYGGLEIPVNKLMAQADATREMLEDSSSSVESDVMSDAGEAFALKEGAAFINGDGVKKPSGIMQNGDIGEYNSGNATLITSDGVIGLAGELKTGYSPVYIMNRKTVTAIRLLVDLDGQYLWQAGMTGGTPNSLNGYSYVEMPDMADIGAGTFPLAFGDFRKGYRIVDGAGMTVIRDDVTQAGDDEVIWTFRRRVGGQVVLPEAIKKLKISA